MKKIFLSAVVLLSVSLIYSQEVQFGIKAGVNLANIDDDLNTDRNARVGVNAGGLAHIHLSKTFAVQPEVVFSMQGAKNKNGDEVKFNYINVPVLGQYMFSNGFRLQTGPQVGFMTSATSEVNGAESDYENSFTTADFGWVLGAGYLMKSGLGIDARYNYGITDISKNKSGVQNRVWQFGLFYQFKH